MPVSIGPRIQVEGEEKYRQQINQIIQQSKTLDAEMKAMAAGFSNTATEQEKAAAASGKLSEQLELARKRTELVRDMTEQATAKFGENGTQTLKWRQALAAAEEQQAALERAVEENTRAIDAQGEEMDDQGEKLAGLGDAVGEFAGKLGIQIPQAATDALNGMDKFSAGSVASMGIAAGAIGAVYKVGKELFDLTRAAAAEADALLTRSAQTGIDTSTLQGLDYASRFLDFDGVDKTLVRFTQNMASAAEGADKQAAAFDRLKISVQGEDGELRNNWETFLDAIDALGEVQNATERDAIANDLFGKSYTELKPLIDAGTGALQSYIDEAEKLGYIIDEETVKKLGALDDAIQQNEASSTALKNTVAGELAPTFTLLTEALTTVQDGFRGIVESDAASGFVGFISSVGSPLLGLVSTIKSFADAHYEARAAMEATSEAVPATVETYEQIQTAAAQMVNELTEISEQYEAAYSAAKTSLDGQFGLWETAAARTATSSASMIEALQSQIDYWNEYDENFKALLSRNIEGVAEFAQNFADGSMDSANALAGLKNATDEEIAAIIGKMKETDQAKSDVAGIFAELETDVRGKLETLTGDYSKTIEELNRESGNLDFSAFETSVDTAFSYLENRAANSVEAVRSMLANLEAEINATGGYNGSYGYNAAGDTNWRGGLTWVGESGPELVELPRGSAIYSNQESRQLLGAGTDTSRIEDLIERVLTRMDSIDRELADFEAVRRMA